MNNDIEYSTYSYRTYEEVKSLLASANGSMALQMAQVYQAAFAGPPWFEKYKCD